MAKPRFPTQFKQYVPETSKSISRGRRSRLSYNLPGMPPGGIAILYDKLHQVFERNKYSSKAVGTFYVDSDGVMRFTDLRDSIYRVLFQNLEHQKYNTEFSVGDSDKFETISSNDLPYPVIISGITTGLDSLNQAFLNISWVLDSHKIDGFYEVWAKKSSSSSYTKWTTIYNAQAREYTLIPLDYSTDYQVYIRTTNQDGLSRGISNIVTGTTYSNPLVSGVLDTVPPDGAGFFF